MTSFADVTDLETWMGLTITDTNRADALLEAASEEVRGAIGQTIDSVSNDVVTLPGSGGPVLFLPQLPVTAITTVKVDGTTLDPSEYTLEVGGALRRTFPSKWLRTTEVEVTYDHGYATIPEDIAAAVKDAASTALAARGLGQAESDQGLLGQVAVAEAVGFGPTILIPRNKLAALRARYGVVDWD